MRERLLDLLRCPTCVARVDLEAFATRGDQIVDGALRCPVCRTVYPIIDHIPRMLPSRAPALRRGRRRRRRGDPGPAPHVP